MGKLVNIAPLADKELKLQDAADYLEDAFDAINDVVMDEL